MRTIEWDDGADRGTLVLIDQTALPGELRWLRLDDVDELIDAIRRLAVRGAPALGAAAALGVLLAVEQGEREGWDAAQLDAALDRLRAARPTAVNLAWGVDRGAERLRLHTHCNAGGLACVEFGTALGIVRALHDRDAVARVYLDETRPLLQGSRLTAWELSELGVDYRVVVDAAGPSLIARGAVDAVVVGADRVAANGDVANKIGTFPLALAAARAGIPFVVAAPESTVDPGTPDGSAIEIEERASEEVLAVGGRRVAPEGAMAVNPAFDVTPADLVTAVVTERRVVRPAAGERPA